MVSSTQDLATLHFEHRLWNSELGFFADELKIYEHRLEELTQKYRSVEVLSGLEHFQNQFIRQKEVLDTLKHDIHIHEQKLQEALQRGEEAPLEPEYHQFIGEQMETFRSIYSDLKKEFYQYLVKWR
jgi:hypothetical protein